jgi:hypothetical protein
MASNAASSVQFRVNGTEMARGRTRKTERSQSMDPRAKPRAAGASKVNVETTVTNGSLSSVPKTQATSVLPVIRPELVGRRYADHGVVEKGGNSGVLARTAGAARTPGPRQSRSIAISSGVAICSESLLIATIRQTGRSSDP